MNRFRPAASWLRSTVGLVALATAATAAISVAVSSPWVGVVAIGLALVVIAEVAGRERVLSHDRAERVERLASDVAAVTKESAALVRRVRDLDVRATEVARGGDRRADALDTDLAKARIEAERLIDRLRRLEVRVAALRRHVDESRTQDRSDHSMMTAHLADRSLPVRRVLLLMTVHRSGSTRLFDVMRSHPATRVDPLARTWESLGLQGRRYLVGLSDRPGAWFPLEVIPGRGAGVPLGEEWTRHSVDPADR